MSRNVLSPARCLAICAVLLSAPALAQSDAELVGRQLQRQSAGSDALAGQLIGALANIEAPTIDSISVSQAEPELLTLSLKISSLDQFDLIARLLRENGQIETRIDYIPLEPIDEVDSGESVVSPRTVRFALPKQIAEGTEFQTHFVSFQLQQFGRALPGLEWRYRLVKNWARAVSPENVVITVAPDPIGEAARLPASFATARPLPKPPQLRLRHELIQPQYRLQRLEQVQLQPLNENSRARVQSVRPLTRAVQPTARAAATKEASNKVEKPAIAPLIQLNPQTLQQISSANLVHKIQLSEQQRQILTRTDLVRARLPNPGLKNITGLKREDRERGAMGPSEQTIDLLSVIRADTDIPVNEILGIHRYLHLDRNPDSGVLYYVPRDFNLRWTPDNGFGFNMLYAAIEEGAAGEVLMALRLESGVRANDNPLIRRLAEAYRQLRQSGLKVEVVRPLPVTSQHPVVSLADSLGAHFNIPADDLVATVFSDVLAEIEVSWVTDEVTKENIELVLKQGLGLGGDVTFTLDSEPQSSISIPARVRLADQATFGRIAWQRNARWRNQTPYPLRLKRLHALLFEGDTPIVYSWRLGETEVPPKARVAWQADSIPTWLDSRASRIWVEYAVVADCAACTDSIMRSITYGAGRAAARESVRVVSLTPLSDLGAVEIGVRLRSRYFNSEGGELTTSTPLVMNADRSEFDGGHVYLVDRQPGEEHPDDPLFEYQVEVVMPDGTIHRPPPERWIASQRSRLLIGRVQIEQSLGYLPGQTDDQ